MVVLNKLENTFSSEIRNCARYFKFHLTLVIMWVILGLGSIFSFIIYFLFYTVRKWNNTATSSTIIIQIKVNKFIQ